jgi:hypothetical protein
MIHHFLPIPGGIIKRNEIVSAAMIFLAVPCGSANRAQVYHRYPKGDLIRENFQNRRKRQIGDPYCLGQNVFYIFVILVAEVVADIELRDGDNRHLPGIVALAVNRTVAYKGIEVLTEAIFVHRLKELILQDAHMTAGRDAEWNPKFL